MQPCSRSVLGKKIDYLNHRASCAELYEPGQRILALPIKNVNRIFQRVLLAEIFQQASNNLIIYIVGDMARLAVSGRDRKSYARRPHVMVKMDEIQELLPGGRIADRTVRANPVQTISAQTCRTKDSRKSPYRGIRNTSCYLGCGM